MLKRASLEYTIHGIILFFLYTILWPHFQNPRTLLMVQSSYSVTCLRW